MRSLGAAAAVLIGAIAVGVLLWQRTVSAPPPRELLAGGNEPPAPRVAPELESLDRGALQAAADYAGEHGSRALIVSRHDHIVFERYWQGSGFDTLADAQSFTPLLAALAAGVAISHRQIGPGWVTLMRTPSRANSQYGPNLIIRAARDYLPPAQPGADVSALVPAHKP